MSIIIVGAGVFGLSTALAAPPSLRVILIDNDQPNSASRGEGRIFRTRYPRPEYEALAEQARPFWEGKGSFHKQLRQVHEEGGTVIEDHNAGWIEARKAMAELLEEAKMKVEFVADMVVSLIWDEQRCIGVNTESGRSFKADNVLLALGGRLPGFLKAEGRPIDDICYPAIVPWIYLQLDDEQYEQLKNTPIVVYPGKGEYLPPNDKKCLWVNNPKTARISDVLEIPNIQDKDSPYYDETHQLFCRLLPNYREAKVVSFHYCMDSMTHSQDFLIGPVPQSEGLFLAGGGSFHAFKLFPIIGGEIIKTLQGENTEYSRIWSVNAHRSRVTADHPVHDEVVPKRAFPDL